MTVDRPVRFRVDMAVQLELGAGGAGVDTRLIELSETGAFIGDGEGLEALEPESRARLALPLPGGAPWSSTIRVVRYGRAMADVKQRGLDHMTVAVSGWGVEFLELPDDELERLRDFLDLLDTR